MKHLTCSLILLPAFLLGLTSASVTMAAAPELTEIKRVQLDKKIESDSKMFQDNKGNSLFIAISESDKDSTHLKISAYDAKNKEISTVELIKPQAPRDTYRINNIHLNSCNELIVILSRHIEGIENGLMAVNLSKKNIINLASSSMTVSFLDRVHFHGHDLIAVSEELEKNQNNQYPTNIRILDENTGTLLNEKMLNFPVEAKFGLDKNKNLKLLLAGYEIFSLLDVASNQVSELAPEHQQPSAYTGIISLSAGKFMRFNDGKELQLLSLPDLFNGVLRSVHTLDSRIQLIGQAPYRHGFVNSANGTLLIDLTTGKPLGPQIPKMNSEKESPAAITEVFENNGKLIATVTERVHPFSFINGEMIGYFDVQTGTPLRKTKNDVFAIQTQLKKLSTGQIISIEKLNKFGNQGEFSVVDILSNKVLSHSDSIDLIGLAFKSEKNDLLSIRSNEQKQLCVFNLLDLTQETCIADSLIQEATKYGYTPFETKDGRLVLPLLGQLTGFSYSQLGFMEMRVR